MALVAVVVAELVVGVAGPVGFEEALNVRAAALVACGHGDLAALRYRPFCGGCSVHALLGAPLALRLPLTTAAARIVPAAFSLLLVSAGWLWWAEHPHRRRAWLALCLGAPGCVVALSQTGWGNHAEGTALVLAGGALWACAKRPWGWAAGLFGGLVLGVAPIYAMSALWAWPLGLALASGGLRRTHRSLLLGLPGLGVGAALTGLWVLSRDDAGVTAGLWSGRAWAPPAALLRWLWSDFVEGGLWLRSVSGRVDGVAVLWWGALLGLGARGVWRAKTPLERGAAAGLLALLCAYALRYDLWHDNPAVQGADFFNLRYRHPLWALLALVAAGQADRRSVRAVVGLLAAVGLGFRVATLVSSPPLGGQPALPVALAPDPTVPVGEPRVRLSRKMGRSQDVAAAMAYLDGHRDVLPVCRAAHLYELGRRVGLQGDPRGAARVGTLTGSEAEAARQGLRAPVR